MSTLRVFGCDYPHRKIALTTDDSVLFFAYTTSASNISRTPGLNGDQTHRCRVEFSTLSTADLSNYKLLAGGHGTIGLITLNDDVFLCVITASSRAATLRPGETVLRIDNVEFFCLNRSNYERADEYQAGAGFAADVGMNDGGDTPTDLPFVALRKLLNDGSFYYSFNFNLTDRLQNRLNENGAFDIDNLDKDMLWNSYMIDPLLLFRSRLTEHERARLDSSRILTSVIRGFANTITIPASIPLAPHLRSNLPSTMTVVSRLSSRRAGTRFNSRGVDDDGNVANYVETETILWNPSGMTFSYVQVRGSVPVFWEQTSSLIPGQQKIEITRSFEATQQAFEKHFGFLELHYGAVHVINLLSETKIGEAELSSHFREHLQRSYSKKNADIGFSLRHELLKATEFDLHAEMRNALGFEESDFLRASLQNSLDTFAFFLSNDAFDGERIRSTVILPQEGVFRTNCLDCLDRTNLVQTHISLTALELFFSQQGCTLVPELQMRHSSLWADNGDALSRIYAGSGALKSSLTRHGKLSLAGAFADVRKSATRLYINNFADKSRQNTIDIMLGRLRNQEHVHLFDPVNDAVIAELSRRVPEYSSQKQVHIWTGTFNLNGKTEGALSELAPWLLSWEDHVEDPTIVAVGFQEIVELSPQQIMSTDPKPRLMWEETVRKCLNSSTERRGTSEYVLLRSGQLVGATLMIFLKADALQEVKNVEGSVKKTGLSGIAGNKGGCAIRLEYSNTSLCFVTAHLAAGFSNDDERNKDYTTISQGLRFQKNRSIEDHDSIIWFGDFNYRIGLADQKVRDCIKKAQYEQLYENDQLNLQMSAGRTFQYYSEGSIRFPPTYKYQIGSSEYDNSEKARIPAWCDRVLWKGSNLRQLHYNSADLRYSDHRPVWALFSCVINTVDQAAKDRLSKSLYDKYGRETGWLMEGSVEEESGNESTAPGFGTPDYPLPSSDQYKWWLDRGAQATSTIRPLKNGQIPNPNRHSNPFSLGQEPDWISPKLATKTARSEGPRLSPSLGVQDSKLRSHDSDFGVTPLPGKFQKNNLTAIGIGSNPPEHAGAIAQIEAASMKSLIETRMPPLERMADRPPIPHKPLSLTNRDRGLANDTEKASTSRPPDSRDKPHSNHEEISNSTLLDGDGSSEMSDWKPLLPQR